MQLKRHSNGKQVVARVGERYGYKKWNFYILIVVVAIQIYTAITFIRSMYQKKSILLYDILKSKI